MKGKNGSRPISTAGRIIAVEVNGTAYEEVRRRAKDAYPGVLPDIALRRWIGDLLRSEIGMEPEVDHG